MVRYSKSVRLCRFEFVIKDLIIRLDKTKEENHDFQ